MCDLKVSKPSTLTSSGLVPKLTGRIKKHSYRDGGSSSEVVQLLIQRLCRCHPFRAQNENIYVARLIELSALRCAVNSTRNHRMCQVW